MQRNIQLAFSRTFASADYSKICSDAHMCRWNIRCQPELPLSKDNMKLMGLAVIELCCPANK